MSKINILVIPSDTAGIGSWRFIEPHTTLQKLSPENFHIELNMNVDWNDTKYLEKFQIIFGSKNMLPIEHAKVIIPSLQQKGIKVIMDIDDYWELSPSHPQYQYAKDIKYADQVIDFLKLVDYVTTTTDVFASEIKKYNKNVLVFPNAVDPTAKKYQIQDIESDKVRLGFLGGSCFDDKTEILTDQGYKFFEDLDGTENVATLNPENNEMIFVKPYDYIKKEFNGELYVGDSKNINFAVTPNHNMYVSVKESKYKNLDFNLTPMEELDGKDLYFKKNCVWNGNDVKYFILPEFVSAYERYNETRIVKEYPKKKILMNDWVKFFGFWIAEGWTSTSSRLYQVGIAQKKPNGILEEMFNLLVKMGFKPTYTKDGHQVRVFNRQLWEYLKEFGKAADKYIPKEILNLKSELLESFLKYYLIGDGSVDKKTGKTVAYTCSKKLADNLCEVSLKVGSSGYIRNRGKRNSIMNDGRKVNGQYDALEVSVQQKEGKRNHLTPLVRKEQISKEKYNGYVYCVSVPSHIIYIRRKGKGFWCGNSHLKDLSLLKPMFNSINEKYKDKIQTVICGFDTRGKMQYRDENGQIKERPFHPKEICWYEYEKIFTSDYKHLNKDYFDWLMTFKKEEYPDVDKQPYRRVWTKPISTYTLNYNLFDISLAPLEINKFAIMKSNLKVVEAGFFKKPIICTDIAPYQIDIKHGENGFLVNNKSTTKDWAYYAKKLIDDPILRKEMGEKLYETVKEKYDIRNVSKQRGEWYKSILK